MSSRSPPLPEAPKESAVSRLLVAPLTFLSFLFSLALIDSHNHSLRTHTHAQSPSTRIHAFFHALIFKAVPGENPYVNGKAGGGKEGGKEGGKGEDNGWHWHTKQRKMMKEMDDAFRIRRSVMGGLVVLGVVGAVVLGVLGSWAVGGWL